MNATLSKKLQKTLIVFPAIAMVISVGCASVSGANTEVSAVAKKTTTTIKKKVTTTTKAPKGSAGLPTALSVLATIPQVNEHGSGYSRDFFKHWIDADHDGCNTREEVLIAESVTHAQVDAYGCKVIAGDWYSPYENAHYTDPAELDIDHMVPLKEAWDSGAYAWNAEQRQQFANDLSDSRPLIAVQAGQNRSKSDKDPSNWIPPNKNYVCTYLANWVAIKSHWRLSMDTSEWGRIKNLLTASCATTTIAPWGSASASNGSGGSSNVTSAPTNTVAPQTSVAPGTSQLATIHPGSFCSPLGAHGTYNGNSYVCATTNASGVPYSDGRARWRQG